MNLWDSLSCELPKTTDNDNIVYVQVRRPDVCLTGGCELTVKWSEEEGNLVEGFELGVVGNVHGGYWLVN